MPFQPLSTAAHSKLCIALTGPSIFGNKTVIPALANTLTIIVLERKSLLEARLTVGSIKLSLFG